MFKKILTIILLIGLLLVPLSGCAGAETNPEPGDAVEAAPEESVDAEFIEEEKPVSVENEYTALSSDLHLSEIVGVLSSGADPDVKYVGFLIDTQAAREFNGRLEVLAMEYYSLNEALGYASTDVILGARNHYNKFYGHTDDAYINALDSRVDTDRLYTIGDFGAAAAVRDGDIVSLSVGFFYNNYEKYSDENLSIDLSSGDEISALSDFGRALGFSLDTVQRLYSELQDFSFYDPGYKFSGAEKCRLITYGWNGLPKTQISVSIGEWEHVYIFEYKSGDMFLILDMGL